jgi:hypothetical protein
MAFAALALEAQTNSDNSQFSLTISALRPSYKVGASVKLKIVMTNTSNVRLTLKRSMTDRLTQARA